MSKWFVKFAFSFGHRPSDGIFFKICIVEYFVHYILINFIVGFYLIIHHFHYRKWTDFIETAWEKRKDTLLADLEESGKVLINVLHQKLEESMTENIQNKLGKCHGMEGISSVTFSQNYSFSECSVRAAIYI